MARPLRLDFPGARHHVMNRGARRGPVFGIDQDCIDFCSVLADLPARFGVLVHAYALMPNHFHLMLETPRGNLSRAMQYLGSEYTRLINARQRWDGPLFRGRFTSRLVEGDDYWEHLLLYLHLNPVKAHLAPNADLSRWSSHAAYAGLEPTPVWLTTEPLLHAHGGIEGYRQTIEDLRVGRLEGPLSFDERALWRPPHSAPAVVRPATPRDLEAALDRVAAVTNRPRAELVDGQRGRGGNPARWTAAWWLVIGHGASNIETARLLGADATQVSRWASRVAGSDDPEIKRWRRILEHGDTAS